MNWRVRIHIFGDIFESWLQETSVPQSRHWLRDLSQAPKAAVIRHHKEKLNEKTSELNVGLGGRRGGGGDISRPATMNGQRPADAFLGSSAGASREDLPAWLPSTSQQPQGPCAGRLRPQRHAAACRGRSCSCPCPCEVVRSERTGAGGLCSAQGVSRSMASSGPASKEPENLQAPKVKEAVCR